MIEKPNRDVTRGVRTSTLTLGCALLVASGSVLSEFSVAVAENISADPPTSPSLRRRVPLSAVTINDTFWAPKLKLLRERTVPFSWNYMGWELRALEKANGRTVQGDLNGTWGEANLHKFLETASHSLALAPDPALERRLDGVIGLLAGAQQPDGYLHAFVTNSKKLPWDPEFLDGSHDGYVLGHMIEAALAYHAATGKTNFLQIAIKAADQAYTHFLGPDGHAGFCGHAELELALVELYRVVPNPKYLELAKAFIEWRGRHMVKPFGDTPRAYFQDEVPFREQKTLEGHAVRAIFFATGVADVALETGDPDYRLAANRFWESTARRRMNIAGGIGPRKEHEAIGEDYELPNDGYYESCAACGLLNFAQRIFLLEGTSEGADVMERVLYNAVLHGISLDGTNTYYTNPLSDKDNLRYNSWVCCPPNLSRTLLQVGRNAYAVSDRDVFVNLFVGGDCRLSVGKETLVVHVDTGYPWTGDVTLKISSAPEQPLSIRLRMPGWCRRVTLKVNGTALIPLPRTEQGYLSLTRVWRASDTIEFSMDMPVERIEAHPNVKDCVGKVALQRGPIVYGFESVDNPEADLHLGADAAFTLQARPELLGGVQVLQGTNASGKPLLAVPFFALANRGKASQEVWVRQDAKPSDSWWLGELYRPLVTH